MVFSNMLALSRQKLKGIVGNEKQGGSRFLQLLGTSLGPWRLMSIFVLNVSFAIEKRISIPALSSKRNRRLVWQKAIRCKQDPPTYKASIYLLAECSEHEKRRGPNKNKSASSNLFHNLRWENFYVFWKNKIRETHWTICSALPDFKVITYSFCSCKRKRK